MTPCVSNIAWSAADDEAALGLVRQLGISSLEIAPTRFWNSLADVSEDAARALAQELERAGVRVSAFQALLFGQPDLLVFGADEGAACLSYLANVCAIARWTGANALVFGSPKNRRRGTLSIDEAFARGRGFFRRLGEIAAGNGVTICLEANPPGYGCDFLETVDAAAEMVAAVDSSGLKLNLDMGEMIMNGADVAHAVESYAPLAAHFHVSEPQLDPFKAERPEHAVAAAALRRVNYRGLVSLEMKTPAGGLAVVNDSLHAMLRVYFAGA